MRPLTHTRSMAAPTPREISRLPVLVGAVACVAAATFVAWFAKPLLPAASLPLLFLVGVLVASMRFGLLAGIVASAGAFFAFNFLFVEPLYTFRVASAEDVLLLAVLLFAGALTGFLGGRVRAGATAAAARAAMLERLQAFTADVGGADGIDAIERLMVAHLGAATGAAVLLKEADGILRIARREPANLELSTAELQAAERAFRRGTRETRAKPGWTGSEFAFAPLQRDVSVVGFRPANSAAPAASEAIFDAMLQQGALAVARLGLAQEAVAARAQAETANVRSALLASLSHDLKTPLATIVGAASSLRAFDSTLAPDARADLLAVVEEESQRLARYVANLLHMTRLKAGLDLRLEWIDAADATQGAIARARRVFPGAPFALALEPELQPVRADATMLEQAIFNILENAAKFSPPRSPVRIALARAGSSLRIRIDDEGSGIAPADRERVFEPFYRTSEDGPPGTGLGLTIARGIVQALGGTVAATGPVLPDGRGTRIEIFLPATTRTAGL